MLGAQPTRRLTRYEYDNTLRQLLGQQVMSAIAGAVALVPLDRTADAIDSLSQGITTAHIRAYYAVAEAIGSHFETTPAAREALAACLAEPGWGKPCIEQMLGELGAKVYRRALDPAEIATLLSLYDVGAADSPEVGLRLVLTAIFESPDFLYRLEVGGEKVDDEVALTLGEIANRLAYYLWGEPPDDALLAEAESGALATDDGLRAAVSRMLEDDRARRHFRHFATQWLLLDRMEDVENVPDHIRDGADTTDLNAAALAEIEQLVDHIVWDERGSYAELMTTPVSFVGAPSLGTIYGVAPAESAVTIADGTRNGLLTRIAFLGDSEGLGDPIHRGKRVRTQLLCGELQQPDPDKLPAGALEDPPIVADQSTRERIAAKTGDPLCAGCHAQINPLGFAMEDFDGLGRHRTTEKIFDELGELIAEVPIDAAVDPAFSGPSHFTVDGASALSAALATDPGANECLVVRWLEFSTARTRQVEDACSLPTLTTSLTEESGSIAALITSYTELPTFRVKRLAK
jgi:hypothetical protein